MALWREWGGRHNGEIWRDKGTTLFRALSDAGAGLRLDLSPVHLAAVAIEVAEFAAEFVPLMAGGAVVAAVEIAL